MNPRPSSATLAIRTPHPRHRPRPAQNETWAGPKARPSRLTLEGQLRDQLPAAPMEAPTVENLLDALLPRVVTAAMQTTAIRATSSAYSTSEAPRSLLMWALTQALRNW